MRAISKIYSSLTLISSLWPVKILIIKIPSYIWASIVQINKS